MLLLAACSDSPSAPVVGTGGATRPASGGVRATGGESRDAGLVETGILDALCDATGTGGLISTGGITNTGGSGAPSLITLCNAGDSTVMTYAAGNTDGNNGAELEGWGQEIGQYFNANVTISNQAVGGRSVGYFMWQVVRDSVAPTNAWTRRDRAFSGTAVNNTLLAYAKAMKDEAPLKKIEVEDPNLRRVEYYAQVGNTFLTSNIFDGGTTHFIQAGAVKMAELIVGEIKKNEGPLSAYVK